MSEIEKVLVVGRGAVGGLFGSLIEEKVETILRFSWMKNENKDMKRASTESMAYREPFLM